MIVLAPASMVAAHRCVASGTGVTHTVEGYKSRFQLKLKDVYANPIDAPMVLMTLLLYSDPIDTPTVLMIFITVFQSD